MKQTFNIPEGCTTVTVEQVDNQIITTFSPERYIPKKGDFIKFGTGFAECLSESTLIERDSFYIYLGHWKQSGDFPILHGFNDVRCWDSDQQITKITQEELKAEFNKLGYEYNFETHTATKIDWRAKNGGCYYTVWGGEFNVLAAAEDNDSVDDSRHALGNYFKTEEEAQEAADFLKTQLKQFKNKSL